jgi:hypothetical protein
MYNKMHLSGLLQMTLTTILFCILLPASLSGQNMDLSKPRDMADKNPAPLKIKVEGFNIPVKNIISIN